MGVRWTRREVLVAGLAATAATAVAGCSDDAGTAGDTTDGSGAPTSTGASTGSASAPAGQPTAAELPPYEPSPDFPEGILSGDPAPDGIVLWTRPSPELVEGGDELVAELAQDVEFAEVVATRSAVPDAGIEGSTAFVIDGLEPGSSYFYRFRIGDAVSPIGLTRTAPADDAEVDELRVAVFSCQRFTHGHYTAHADLAAQAPDLVISLGDYVYNTGEADDVDLPDRNDPVQDATTLDDFRRKYEHYRSDVNLQAMHRVAPIVAIPDNHDGATDPDDDMYPGAPQAFFEKMPVRRDPDDEMRTHRRVRWGQLLDLWMLDLMRYRTPGDRGSGNTDGDLDMMDPEVTYLGEEQRAWLFDGLAASGATWLWLGSAKQFSPLRIRADDDSDVPNAGTYINMNQWDGYQAERMRVLEEVERLGLTNVVAVTGDMHWFWAADVPKDFNDPESPPVMVDFLCGGISSSNANERIAGGEPQTSALMQAFGPANINYARFFDADRHGYGLFTLRSDGAEVEYRSPTTILEPEAETEVVARFRLDPTVAGIELVEPEGWPAGLVPQELLDELDQES